MPWSGFTSLDSFGFARAKARKRDGGMLQDETCDDRNERMLWPDAAIRIV